MSPKEFEDGLKGIYKYIYFFYESMNDLPDVVLVGILKENHANKPEGMRIWPASHGQDRATIEIEKRC